ncbi:10845_t:CDS:2 [Acaulospora colombiana]|uniref:10845_t:CDS:1 n=1 Tax=Acaulospora colombiana TaxID=27376 RepID=A0ACA9K190_9GLOM|nr:10845_t:CDS:2 [Acaulospora colombiana]
MDLALFRIALFQGLRNERPEERKEALAKIERIFEILLAANTPPTPPTPLTPHTLHTPTSSTSSVSGELSGTADVTDNDVLKAREALDLYILTILRMSVSCPYADVRHAFKKLLKKLKSSGVTVPERVYNYPSLYIPAEEMFRLEWSDRSPEASPESLIGIVPDESVQHLMLDSFINSGRIHNYYQILFQFPKFAEKYKAANTKLMKADPCVLPKHYKYYIGIMAASQHKCQCLVSHLRNEFLFFRGDPEWLKGLEHAPPKIKKIAKINTILAHQPWQLEPKDIRHLRDSPDKWTYQEIIHIIIILSTFHSLSSYVLSCGIVPEYDAVGGYKVTLPSDSNEAGASIGLDTKELVSQDVGTGLGISVKVVKQLFGTLEDGSQIDDSVKGDEIPGSPKPEVDTVKDGETIGSPKEDRPVREGSLEDDPVQDGENQGDDPAQDGSCKGEELPEDNEFVNCDDEAPAGEKATQKTEKEPDPIPVDVLTKDFSCYLDSTPYSNAVFGGQDYRNASQLNSLDFNWSDHGTSKINQYHPGLGDVLGEEFGKIREINISFSPDLTEDKSSFREAIWQYVFRLYGVKDDGYDYRNIKIFLKDNIRCFIKKACTKPEDITREDWNSLGSKTSAKEKCYIILVSIEARKQAELLHGLWCVCEAEKMKYTRQLVV